MYSLILVLILFKLTNEQVLDVSDYDIYGKRLSLNEYFGVLSANDLQSFIVFHSPYQSLPCTNLISYNFSNQFIYTVTIGSKQNSSRASYAYLGEYENASTNTIQIFFGIETVSSCPGSLTSQFIGYLSNLYQRNSIIGIDPYGNIIFIISSLMIYIYDINTGLYKEFNPPFVHPWKFSPHSILIDQNQTAHVVGYYCYAQLYCYLYILKIIYDPITFSIQTSSQPIGNGNVLMGKLFCIHYTNR